MEDRCVCCGAVIPEGRQVCPVCERGKKKGEIGFETMFNMFCQGYDAGYKAGKEDAMGINLVRCKDCKYRRYDLMCDDDNLKWCSIGYYLTKEDGFCSYGERRKDG